MWHLVRLELLATVRGHVSPVVVCAPFSAASNCFSATPYPCSRRLRPGTLGAHNLGDVIRVCWVCWVWGCWLSGGLTWWDGCAVGVLDWFLLVLELASKYPCQVVLSCFFLLKVVSLIDRPWLWGMVLPRHSSFWSGYIKFGIASRQVD